MQQKKKADIDEQKKTVKFGVKWPRQKQKWLWRGYNQTWLSEEGNHGAESDFGRNAEWGWEEKDRSQGKVCVISLGTDPDEQTK